MSIFDDYEQELLAKHAATKDAEREADMAHLVKQRQMEIDAGLRDAEGEWIGFYDDEVPEESEEEDDEEEDDL